MLLRKGRGMQVRQYFNLVDRALRDKMGEGLWSRLQMEDPKYTKEKEEYIEYKTGAYGQPGNYDYGLHFGKMDFKYHGITDDENTRFQSHKFNQHGKVHNWTWKPDAFPRFKEACRDRYFATEKVAIPDFMRGFKGMYENNEHQWAKIDKFCDDLTERADQEYMLKLHETARHDSRTGVILSTPEEYPTARSKQKPRKRKHSWDDGPIVHYDYTKSSKHPTPVLVQEGPALFHETHRQKSASKKLKHSSDKTSSQMLKWKKQLLKLPKEQQQQILELLQNQNS